MAPSMQATWTDGGEYDLMNDSNEPNQKVSDETAASAPAEAGHTGAPPAEDPAALREALAEAEARAAESEERYLRAKAEAENTRRRAEIDVANARKYAIERFAGELLAVKDSLELARAVDLAQDNVHAVEKMFEGIELTLKLLNSIFEKFAIREVAPEPGDKFDPEVHQAMSLQESSEVPPNHVVSVVQKGYLLNDRLLRPAMVIVAKAPAEAAGGGPAGQA